MTTPRLAHFEVTIPNLGDGSETLFAAVAIADANPHVTPVIYCRTQGTWSEATEVLHEYEQEGYEAAGRVAVTMMEVH